MHLILARHRLAALIAYILLTIVFTWPLLPNLSTHVIGAGTLPGDNYEYVWKMWWVPHAIFERGTSPFFHPDVAYPDGYPLAYGEITPSHTFLLMPLTLLFGATVAYNLAIMLSAVLTGWFTYILAWRRLRDIVPDSPQIIFTGAFFAGTALAFCVYRAQRIAGHLPLIDTHWLVLAILAFDLWLETRRLTAALLIGLAISLAALSSWYYGFMLALLLPVYLIAYIGSPRNWRGLLADKRTWLALLAVGVVVILVAGPFLLPYLRVSAEGAADIPIEDVRFWSASPLDYILPNPRQPLWSNAIQSIAWPVPGVEMPYEFMLSLGWASLFLGIIGWRQMRGAEWRATKWLLVAAFILSLGPYLTIGRLPTPLPLPVLWLRDWLPFAGGLRSWGRFALMVMLGFALLAGAGLVNLLKSRTPRNQALITSVAFAILVIGMWSPNPLNAVHPRPVDEWLAQQPDRAPIMQYPVNEALSGPSMFYTRYHGKPVVFGYGTYYPFLFRARYPELLDFPADASLNRLSDWGVHYILVNNDAFDTTLLPGKSRLSLVDTFDNQAVYELLP